MLTIDIRDTHMYPVMILCAFLTGLVMQFLLNRSRGIRREIAALNALASFLCSIGGAVLLTWIASGGRSLGFSALGGLMGMYAGSALVGFASGRQYYPQILAQTCTLVLPVMYGIGKIGCLLAGCCRGIPYHGAGCVAYLTAEGTVTVLPVQLLETVCFFGIFAAGVYLYHRRVRIAVHLVFQASMWIKLLLDFLRGSHAGQILSVTQLLCLALIAADLALLLRRRSRQRAGGFPAPGKPE